MKWMPPATPPPFRTVPATTRGAGRSTYMIHDETRRDDEGWPPDVMRTQHIRSEKAVLYDEVCGPERHEGWEGRVPQRIHPQRVHEDG